MYHHPILEEFSMKGSKGMDRSQSSVAVFVLNER
jgi:hypothetical protein